MNNKEFQKYKDKIKEINKVNTNELSEEQLKQLAQYTKDVLEKGEIGSYRYLIYDVLNPPIGYADGMFLGLLEYNNLLHDLKGKLK